ncbi:class I SAM-dependent methyltransferase [Alkalihalobacillus sp. 1P02AB]|uniref:class I SAM-dependent methyltransferase n=1 Tax=Alkalihalobacillus sp. 1P02AB TaxID=3132260 RepID=UPI0039A6B883
MGMDSNELKQQVQAQFGKNAQNYVTSHIHSKGKDLKKLVELLDCSGEEQFLDIATGGGHVANAVAPLVKQVVALDLTKEILQVAKKFIEGNGNSNVDYVEASADALPFADHQFDRVTCRIAAHHFPNIEDFLKEVYRVLKPNGLFILIDNVAPENKDCDQFYNYIEKVRDYSHQRAYKKTEWLKEHEKVGFELIEMHLFEKVFDFENWCRLMDVGEKEKEELTHAFLQADDKIKAKFRVTLENGKKVQSFQGESALIKAKKLV